MIVSYDQLKKSKLFKLFLAGLPIIICWIALFSLSDVKDTTKENYLVMFGAGFGLFYSAIVLILHLLKIIDTAPPFALLFWRAFCDLGVAMRIILSPYLNKYVCGGIECDVDINTIASLRCGQSAAILQFFMIASECWFFCNGIDLYYSITNPFSSFDKRIRYYHLFTWTISIVYAGFPLLSDNVLNYFYGNFYVSDKLQAFDLCWVKLHGIDGDSVNTGPLWIMVGLPVGLIYLSAIFSLYVAYNRLKYGISRSFLSRVKLLVTNTTNMTCLLLYWLILGIVYLVSLNMPANVDANDMILFIIASKGFSAFVVPLLVTDRGGDNEDSDSKKTSSNKALREEVLHFATAGIRSTCFQGYRITSDHKEITRRPIKVATDEQSKNLITPYFFFKFALGQAKVLAAVEVMVSNKRKSQVETFRYSTYVTDSELFPADRPTGVGMNSVMEQKNNHNERLSERPTMTSHPISKSVYVLNDSSSQSSKSLNFGHDFDPENPSSNRPSAAAAKKRTSNKSDTGTEGRVTDVFENGDREADSFFVVRKSSLIVDWFKKILKQTIFEVDSVEFTEFEPFHFRRIRYSVGITDEIYRKYFSTTIKERLTQGGASGAFFFFSKDEKFIAKSCSKEELNTIRANAKSYADYMTTNKYSYISKIFGAYRLKIYGNSLYFFVMNNLFLNSEGLVMNEKYDIKGSWVARSATPPQEGQIVSCTHCIQKYVYTKRSRKLNRRMKQSNSGLSDKDLKPFSAVINPVNGLDRVNTLELNDPTGLQNPNSPPSEAIRSKSEDNSEFSFKLNDECPYTVNGEHVPNIVLKDNDLKNKIRLPVNVAGNLMQQITLDANFLFQLGIMDYSLLIGVHNTEYVVEAGTNNLRRSSNAPPYSQASPQPTVATNRTPFSTSKSNDENDVDDDLLNNKSRVSRPSVGDKSEIPMNSVTSITELMRGEPKASEIFVDSIQTGYVDEDAASTRKMEVYRVLGPDSYFVGIIDFQQKWNWAKKLERFFKVNIKGEDPNGLSAINPEIYRDRQ
eukprot:gene14854-19964_t